MNPRTHDIGAYLQCITLAQAQEYTTANDSTAVDGIAIDRNLETNRFARSMKVAISYGGVDMATASAGATIIWNLQSGASTTAWTDYDDKDGTTGQSVTLTTADIGVSAGSGVDQADFDLGAAPRYLRLQYTVTMADGDTVLANVGFVGVLGGPPVFPHS